ncbi:hypothetical protein LCGC14_0700120 [marine sediment metagenome]|uniref:Uncharacterized protein n=1 Tax=marine sediment metagenome TaxID=412755 RepID=A0A0F9QHZ7_9ZZZZ
MTWGDKLLKKRRFIPAPDAPQPIIVAHGQGYQRGEFDFKVTLTSAVLEKNKEIEIQIKKEYRNEKLGIPYDIRRDVKQARAFRELVEASKKVGKL